MKKRHPIRTTLIMTLLIGLLFGLTTPSDCVGKTHETDQLIVFSQENISPIDTTFQRDRLPEIRRLAEQMGVSVHIVDAGKGSPKEIAVTPLIVYQNHRGRSIYQGRTSTPARIRNFIRTSRFIPQGNTPNQRKNIPIWEMGRTRVWAPLKVTRLVGSVPDNFDHGAFASETRHSIVTGFKNFELQKRIDLGRADRGFYMDFYPYLSGDDTLYLSVALFSQFNCKEPVFKKKLQGPWNDRNRLFRRSATVLETAVSQIIQNPQSGDSFDPVAETSPEKGWEEIGFPLPPQPPKKELGLPSGVTPPRRWVYVEPGPMDPPMIQFRFPAPLDSYAGEVKRISGEFNLSETLGLSGAGGFIEIDTRSAITMGNAILDEVIRGSIMLDSKTHPTATFVITSIESSDQGITFGRLFPASINGTFSLKGKSIPLTSPGEFELVIGEDETPRLLIRSAFKIDLRIFDIEGADGPAPAGYTLLFDINLLLKERKKR